MKKRFLRPLCPPRARVFPSYSLVFPFFALLFLFFGTVLPIFAQENTPKTPFTLEADEITYSEDKSLVTAKGNIEIDGEQGRIRADKLEYTPKTGALIAEGNVAYTDADGNILTLSRLEITGEMKETILENIRFRLPGLGEVLSADRAFRRDGEVYTLYNIKYSPCKTCKGEKKPWQIKAKEVKYNVEDEVLSYKGAMLDIYGVPILYMPYFSHSVGTKPKSGLLPLRFGRSNVRGDEMTISGYIFNPKTNADYTLRSRLMSSRGAQFMAERRQKTLMTDTEIRGSYMNDTYTGKIRANGQFIGEYTPQEGRRFGLNAEFASDDDYLYEYFERNDAYLPTTAYFEQSADDYSFSVYGRWYQDLNETHQPRDVAHVLPSINYEKWWNTGDKGAQILWKTNTMALYRAEGVNYRRLSTGLSYIKPLAFKDGSKIDLSASLRGDVYQVDGDTTIDDGTAGRILPEVTLSWEKPYISAKGSHILTPRAMAVVSPRGGNPDDIPNEDSVAYELDVTNLFQTSRFAGIDRVESGQQFIYGLDSRWGGADKSGLHVFLGQSIRKFDDQALPVSGGTAEKISDWVGFVESAPTSWLTFGTRFRLDSSNFGVKRQDTSLSLGHNITDTEGRYMRLSHTYLEAGPEELNLNARWNFNDTWAVKARSQRDLAAGGRELLGEMGVIYTYDCFRIAATARRRGFTNANLQPSTDFLLNLELLTLGRDRK